MSQVTDYINATDYDTLVPKLRELVSIHDDLLIRAEATRKLRYAEIDIEEQRSKGTVAPDELIIPQKIIDGNIRGEQPAYIKFVTQSTRAVIVSNDDDPTIDMSLLELDLTKKLRQQNWQLEEYSNIDAFQLHGYSFVEVVYDAKTPGHSNEEHVKYEDFAFIADTKDVQAVEMTSRKYYFTRTKLVELAGDTEDDFDKECVDKLIGQEPTADSITSVSAKDASLFKVYKNMWRVGGKVVVAWSMPDTLDKWLRQPRPLDMGRRVAKQIAPNDMIGMLKSKAKTLMTGLPDTIKAPETIYPYFLYPYAISEDDTICNLHGRGFLDQDTQEAITSIISSLVTKVRRSAGLYFAREDGDPNASILMEKNIAFKTGAILNGKIKEMKIDAPDALLFSAVQILKSDNKAETSQVNWAENNRQGDSRKTAAAIKASGAKEQELTSVQVVLYSLALRQKYQYRVDIIKSRVAAGLIKVNPTVAPQYTMNFTVKPSGDVDVIERQQLIQLMQQAWEVVQNTPLAMPFFIDLIKLMFPLNAARYTQVIQQTLAQQQVQAQSAQAQQTQQLQAIAQKGAAMVETLDRHPEVWSDTGKVFAKPQVDEAAYQVEHIRQQTKQQQGQQNGQH